MALSPETSQRRTSAAGAVGTTTSPASSKRSSENKPTITAKAAKGKEVTKKSTKSSGTNDKSAPVASKAAGAASVSASAKQKGPALPIPPKPGLRYSDKDLAAFRTTIERSKEDAIEELRMLKERLEDLTNSETSEESAIYSMHMAEQGSEAIEKEKTYAQIQRIQDYLRKLDEALQRIDDKTYGICRMCGILIAKERLMAVPITTLSASYKIHQRCPDDGIDRIVAKNPDALK